MLLHACGHLAIFSRDNVRSNAFILLNLHVITTREISGYLQIYASFCTLLTRTLHDLSTSFQFNRLEAQGWSWQRILAGYAIPFELRDIRGKRIGHRTVRRATIPCSRWCAFLWLVPDP